MAQPRRLSGLVVPRCGSLKATGDPFEPYRLVDEAGAAVEPVTAFLRELAACGRSAATQRSYGMDLLRWFRFLDAVGISWDEATRAEARDFCQWLREAARPASPGVCSGPMGGAVSGEPGGVTGTPAAERAYAVSTRAHSESVVRTFYDFHVEAGSGPMVNPFPLARDRSGGRANAHHNPLEPFRGERAGRYRPKAVRSAPRCIPDEVFSQLFAQLPSHRDRALVAFWVSTGARASELLGCLEGDVDPGQQLITVIRKGTRSLQQLPASPDAFVWLRLYQTQMQQLVPAGRDQPLWWTLVRPFHRLTYHGARAMVVRAGAALGATWSIHDLRHTAAYRMARDPGVPLTDIQWILGHAHLSTTQIYLRPLTEDVIANVLAFHDRRRRQGEVCEPGPAAGYRPDSLKILFGGDRP